AATQAGGGLSPVQQLLARAIRNATGAEAVMQGVSAAARIPAGEVSVRDAWRVVPYENRVGVLHLTPAELRLAMEEDMAFWGTDRYVPVSGIGYDLFPNAPEGERVRNLRWPDGRPIHGRQRIAVAASSYLLAGGGGRFPRLAGLAGLPGSRLEWAPKTLRDMLADEIKRTGTLEIPPGDGIRVHSRERRPWERVENFEGGLE
ncbi:MAG: 5'-nucleotidase C-terminal domain-containing protein, partial [Kiritimatiellae bacterium]|nr:5'-nucleotidase C-terminal domain-containing protein [Kiritimatiellia bacterium]